MAEETVKFAPLPPSKRWTAVADVVIMDTTLTSTDFRIFCILSSHASRETQSWSLKIKTIAAEAGLGETAARDAIKRLLARGVIERRFQYRNGKQIASEFHIVGGDAPCYQNQGAEIQPTGNPNPSEIRTPTPSEIRTPLLEPDINKIKDTLTGGDAAPQAETTESKPQEQKPDERFPISEAPQAMRQTAQYLLLRTGRKALTEAELSALRTLNAHHYPARVQQEIDKAVERYGRLKRPLASLSFVYIADSLARQTSRPLPRGAGAHKAPAREQTSPPQGRQKRWVEEHDFSEEELDRMMASLNRGGKEQ